MHAMIGPNGAGKSTLLNVLSGVYRATAGEVRYGGAELTRLRPHQIAALGVARTFQNLALSPDATVRENLLLGRHRLTGRGSSPPGCGCPARARERAEQARVVAGSPPCWGSGTCSTQPMGALPYGVRKRAEVARAVCTEPDLLLLDEPVAGMNADESAEMARRSCVARGARGLGRRSSSTTCRSSWGWPSG